MGDYLTSSNEAILKSLGEEIRNIKMSTRVEPNELIINFKNGNELIIFDGGQDCCEHRYMHTDDTLKDFENSLLLDIEVREGPEEGETGDIVESKFVIVVTSSGSFTIVNYNEHNGYYGGFSLMAQLLEEKE